MYQPLSFAEYWQAIYHCNQQEAKQTLQAEGLTFHSPANALRYEQARDDCRMYAKQEDWTMVTAMLEEMHAIKTDDQLEAMEAHYTSPEYQDKKEDNIQYQIKDLRAEARAELEEIERDVYRDCLAEGCR